MWNLSSALLGIKLSSQTASRLAFLIRWTKTLSKLFFVLWVLLTWIFQGSPEGGALWALLFTAFIGGGAVYLRWHDSLNDIEVLALLNRQPGTAGQPQFRGKSDLVGAEHE